MADNAKTVKFSFLQNLLILIFVETFTDIFLNSNVASVKMNVLQAYMNEQLANVF